MKLATNSNNFGYIMNLKFIKLLRNFDYFCYFIHNVTKNGKNNDLLHYVHK